MSNIFFSILPIFIITMLGSGIRRYWLKADEFWKGLEKLSYYLLFPAVLFNYISDAKLGSGAHTSIVLGLIISTMIVASGLVFYQRNNDVNPAEFTSIFQGATRYNNYIFFALGASLYGEQGLGIVSVISAYMIIFTNVIAVVAMNAYIKNEETEENQSYSDSIYIFLKNCGTNPLIIASIAGFIFNYGNIEINVGVQKALQSLSDAALAMGLINVGAGLRFKINHEDLEKVMFTSGIKLLILPIVTTIILMFGVVDGLPRAIAILYSALPCSSSSFILAKQLGGDSDLMASIITATTILSVITISLVLYLVV